MFKKKVVAWCLLLAVMAPSSAFAAKAPTKAQVDKFVKAVENTFNVAGMVSNLGIAEDVLSKLSSVGGNVVNAYKVASSFRKMLTLSGKYKAGTATYTELGSEFLTFTGIVGNLALPSVSGQLLDQAVTMSQNLLKTMDNYTAYVDTIDSTADEELMRMLHDVYRPYARTAATLRAQEVPDGEIIKCIRALKAYDDAVKAAQEYDAANKKTLGDKIGDFILGAGDKLTESREKTWDKKRAEYQGIIQGKCVFSNDGTDVWKVIDDGLYQLAALSVAKTKADAVYEKWAKSYETTANKKLAQSARPSGKSDKQIIIDRGGVSKGDADALWGVLKKHAYADSVIKKWADSYYSKLTVQKAAPNKTSTLSTAAVIKVAGVSLDSKSGTVDIGKTKQLKATVAPSNAADKTVTWATSNANVATVNGSGLVTAKAAGTATITATTKDGQKKAAFAVTVPAKTQPGTGIKVVGVSLDSKSGTVDAGKTKQLKATVAPSNAADKTVTWATSNANVATVNGSGLVTAKAAGTATITVTTRDGQKKATSTVTVPVKTTPPVPVNNANTSARANYQKTIQAKCQYHNPADVWKAIDKHAYADALYKTWAESYSKSYTKTRPSNQTDKQIIQARCNFSDQNAVWSVIEKNHGYAASLLKTWADSYYPTATVAPPVNPPVVKVTGVSLNSTSGTVDIGKTKQLTATVSPSNAADKTVTWATSNANVATVNGSGLVTAKAAGTATITATTRDGQKKAASTVTVPAPVTVVKVTGVSLDSSGVTVGIGATRQLTATVSPSNAADRAVTWASGNANIANVSTSGLVTARSAGTATITATTRDGQKKATCTVTVPTPAPVVAGPAPLSRADCRSIIQARARYNEAEQAWRVIESLTIADTVYQKWAKSNLSMQRTFPSNMDNDGGYKSIIQRECGFTSAEINAIWEAIGRIHKDERNFKRVWAMCYYDR